MHKIPKIIIIEDEETICAELDLCLRNYGYQTGVIKDFSDAAGIVLDEDPDLVLMDVNLPGVSGLSLCEEIRRTSQVPIIFVTGNNTSMDELDCILRGGDDYVSKPYQLPVLMARIGAVLKRTFRHEEESLRLEHKGVLLDIAAAQASKDGKKTDLTRNELKILHFLFRHPGEIVSRADLIEDLWDNEVFIDDNTLSVNITRIRNKLGEIGAADFVETKRGLGYRI